MKVTISQEVKDYLKSLTYVEIRNSLFSTNELMEEFIDDVNNELNFDFDETVEDTGYSDEQQQEYIMYLYKCIWDIKNNLI